MQRVEKCPNCGAQSQYRKQSGDIACAYCDTVLFFEEYPMLSTDSYVPLSSLGTMTMCSGTCIFRPRDVWTCPDWREDESEH